MVMCALIPINDPSPIAFYNVYEEGDEWIKIKGCESCSYQNRMKCCGTCPMSTDKGCLLHIDKRSNINKPYYCIVTPNPIDCISYCCQEYKCVKGIHINKIRKISLPNDNFI